MGVEKQEKICQNCQKSFVIEPDDFSFCEKMEVNIPDLCPQCGLTRLTTLRNERVVYWSKCGKCGKKTMSLYSQNSPYLVYCHDCWWGDSWEGLDYGVEYNDSQTLIEQIKNLQKKVPREAIIILNSVNCDYGNNVRDSKNCYFSFLTANCERLLYSIWMVGDKDCMEDHKVVDSQLTIHSVDTAKCYKSAFLQDCSNCSFCYFSYDLKECNNCLFCSNLRNKSYCVKNKQVSKEEYDREYKNVFNGSFEQFYKSIVEYKKVRENAIHKFAFFLKTNDSVGNYLQNSTKSYWCFDGLETQDVRYVASILYSKNSSFSYAVGTQPTEFIFGGCVIKGGSMIKNSFNIFNSSFCTYCDSLISCNNCLGCLGLKKKEYCILNKQYTKEKYEKIVKNIKDKGELGLFIDQAFSTFSYNETVAQDYYPIDKKEALRQGYTWQDEIPITTGQETILLKDIPDNIKNVDKNILKEIFACIKCKRNYKVVADELVFLQQFNLPLPRECPQCRMAVRREMRLPFKLWHRHCMKEGCPNEFETSYAPDRPEKIYCEICYNKEVY